jgi:serine/threonine-protein kinase RsbW
MQISTVPAIGVVLEATEVTLAERAVGRDAGMGPAGIPTKVARAGLPSSAMLMRGTEKVVELDIPSRIGMLETADVLVGHLASTAGFDLDSSLAIQTALHEALLNAIVHGNDEDETRRVNVELAARAGGLDVRVRDEGPGFDPTSVPDPLAPENLSKSSGRGIFLMRMLMDEVAFRCLSDGGMEVTMRKRLSACEESA